MGFTGPGIACDWLDVEGPMHDVWPPRGAQAPLRRSADRRVQARRIIPASAAAEAKPGRQEIGAGKNQPDPVAGIWTVQSEQPLVDADRLLAEFLPRAFRRPVDADDVRKEYVASGRRAPEGRRLLRDGDALGLPGRALFARFPLPRRAGRQARRLCPGLPAVVFLLELDARREAHEPRRRRASCTKPDVLQAEVERLLQDPKSQRFVEDFLGQWLKLRQIAANDPDRKLYPEFSPYLQDSMVAETRAYFRELLDKNLDAGHLVKSDFAMLNEKLAVHYGIPGVSGSQIRRVPLPAGLSARRLPDAGGRSCKVTANGTTTSPVPRGAFVMDRLLGKPPGPPPPNIPAVEPDVRGATTIREQLDKHRANADLRVVPREDRSARLRAGIVRRDRRAPHALPLASAPATRPRAASIDPFIGIGFKLGPPVDPSGVLPDGRVPFARVPRPAPLADDGILLTNLARQFAVYSTGREPAFRDRKALDAITGRAEKAGGGVRSLLLEVIQDPLFQAR